MATGPVRLSLRAIDNVVAHLFRKCCYLRCGAPNGSRGRRWSKTLGIGLPQTLRGEIRAAAFRFVPDFTGPVSHRVCCFPHQVIFAFAERERGCERSADSDPYGSEHKRLLREEICQGILRAADAASSAAERSIRW